MQIAIDAIRSSREPHIFLSVTKQGHCAIFETRGNQDCHVILRGGAGGPNYSADHVHACSTLLERHGLPVSVMVDCSHGNSQKNHERQVLVANELAEQISGGASAIIGLMLESNIQPGSQDLATAKPLQYGVSITDACIGWETTESTITTLARAAKDRRARTRTET